MHNVCLRCLFFKTIAVFRRLYCYLSMRNFFDIHTHYPTGNVLVTEVENLYFGQVASLQTSYLSVGLHPWFLEAASMDRARQWLVQQAALTSVIAIGEAGLDKICDTPWSLQEAAFRFCIEVSETLHKPLVIHCVRAHNEVIQIKKELNPKQTWIFHGYNKHPDTARMLLREGCFLSFGAALKQAGNHSTEALQLTPDNRFFLETDDDQQHGIAAIYEQAASIRGISLEYLKVLVAQNVRDCFGPTIAY